jgi:hypothetical protein
VRTISATARAAMNAEETGEFPIVLLKIDHPDLGSPFYLSSDPLRLDDTPTFGTISRGNTYLFVPFSLVLPDDKTDAPPTAQITIDNIDRSLIPILRSTTTPSTVTMEVVLASAPNIVELSFADFDLVAADYNADTITITLAQNALQTEPFPCDVISPSNFPGLFA